MSRGMRLGSSRAARETSVRTATFSGLIRTTPPSSSTSAPGVRISLGTRTSWVMVLPARRSWASSTVCVSAWVICSPVPPVGCSLTLLERYAQRLERHLLHHEASLCGDVVVPAVELRTEYGDPGHLVGTRGVLETGYDVEGRLDEVGGSGRAERTL